MPAPIDDKILERYLKVKTLWERAEGNEKANAAKVMGSMQNAYPGIEQWATGSDAAQRVPTEPGPSWTQAMADAVSVLSGYSNPWDVIHKYAPYIDGIGNGAPQPEHHYTDPVDLLSQFARVDVRDSVRGLRLSINLDAEVASIIDEYVSRGATERDLARLAHRAGDMVGRRMFQLLKEWQTDD